jgi:hypothetical protein
LRLGSPDDARRTTLDTTDTTDTTDTLDTTDRPGQRPARGRTLQR